MNRPSAIVALTLVMTGPASATEARVAVVSSQPAFLDIALQVGGDFIAPGMLGPNIGAASGAQVVVIEGGSFDAWATPFLGHLPKGSRVVRARETEDPMSGFSWYDLDAVVRMSRTLAAELSRRLPDQTKAIAQRLEVFEASLGALRSKANEVATTYRDSPVLLTDARFGPLVRMLHLRPVTPLAAGQPSATAAFIHKALRMHDGTVLIYNSETTTGLPESLRNDAEDAGVPLAGVRETMPSGLHYQQWIRRTINTIQGALNEAAP